MPSVIKPAASACNHSILTPRHQSAVQQYRPIINPQDVPTLKSFPSHPEAAQSEATFGHLVRIYSCSLRHRWQEQSESGSPTGMFSTCRIKMIPSRCHGHYKHCKSDSTPKTPESKCGLGVMEGGHDEPVGWNVIPQSVGMVDSHNRGLELSSKLCSGKEMFPAVGLT